ncbi:gliding motility-associated ABC transporter permease subunit GldF [Cytophagales bacterium LB-30]|uniref:Gliding motility-associated ABC transporter permease subunit GldF n=1 Tax=Shiella aurantiaca TaxID=3058365 RepID=A0ABT8F3A7_9BACT|nr:gliding motility-associated ABC transporter permease subunit GldF [Shiella aurantiaca]MDN4164932.1 gliding motility-associated ABC transporter permease subunit GldF [Shiella aurantiaca]
MIQIFWKELSSFFSSLIAYLVVGIFLIITGLLTWVFPETSVLTYGFADMATLFSIGPYVFMFLIPAITMRSFAEEKKTGTIEMLFTKPISEWDIILGKYFASLAIVLLAIVPTTVYFYSIYHLGNPVGNIDVSGVVGSYIGLFFLGAIFTAIGIFASSLSDNQIVAFILAVFMVFVFYTGFSSLAQLPSLSSMGVKVMQLGILYHYEIMSKGLIDLRNVVYFVSVSAFFILCTQFVLSSRKW